MSRINQGILIALVLCLLSTTSARAGNPWTAFWRTTARNNAWPKPFVFDERRAVMAPFHIMEVNGWRRQNLMGAHHFMEGSTELTPAGKRKVLWILTQAPPQRRSIFIERGETPEVTAERIDAVQQLSVKLVPGGQLPDVQDTHLVYEGHPAESIDRTNVKFQETSRSPQLPAPGGGGGEE